MVQQTSGSGLFRYSADDVQADHQASQAATGAQRPASIDYVTLQGGAGIGGSATLNLHNGNVYAGASVSASRETGLGIIFGMIPDSIGKTVDQEAKDTDSLLQGQSIGGNGCLFGVCGGLNYAVGGSTAVEIGVGIGGVTKAPNPAAIGVGATAIKFLRSRGLRMQSTSHLNWKAVLIGMWILSCVGASIIFGAGNPPKKQSEAQLAEMDKDMSYALREGGTIDSRYSNAKIGGALLYVNILKNSWSQELAKNYKKALQSRGWVEKSNEANSFMLCKNKALATVNLIPEVDGSHGLPREVYGFSMKYGADAAKICQ